MIFLPEIRTFVWNTFIHRSRITVVHFHVKQISNSPSVPQFITDRSNAVVLFCSMLPVFFCVRVSVTFPFTSVHIILVRVRLLSGHLLGNSCSLGWPYVNFCILTICNISLFPVLVLRAGFWF